MELKFIAHQENNKYFLCLNNNKTYLYSFELSWILNIPEDIIIHNIQNNNGNSDYRIYFNTIQDYKQFIEWIDTILIVNKLISR
mgnify:CR=1 FL=1